MNNQFTNFRCVFAAIILCIVAPANAIDEQKLRTFLSDEDYRTVRVSPDGKHLSLLMLEDERYALVVLDTETMQPTAKVQYAESKNIEIMSAQWVTDELLSYSTTRQTGRVEGDFVMPNIFLLSADSKFHERIWSFEGNYEDEKRRTGKLITGFPSLITRLEDDDNKVLLYVRPFSRDGADRGGVYTLELDSGDVRQVSRVPEYTSGIVGSDDGSVLVASTLDREYVQNVYISTDRGDWESIEINLGGFNRDYSVFDVRGDYIFATAQEGSAIDAPTHIVRYRMSTGDWEDVARIGFATLTDAMITDDGVLTMVTYNDGTPVHRTIDASDKTAQVVSYFAKNYEGFSVSIVSETEDKSKIVLHVSSGAHAGEYFLFDFESRKAKFLVAMREAIDGNELSELEDATYTSSDGVKIPGWYQAPRGVEKPPLIVDIHGGPHGPYSAFGFTSSWHILNEMGYAVYAPNFRGSGGYGPNFEQSGYGEWGTRMIDDMYEGVQALVADGRANPERVCTYGGSYGGYASAQSLVRHNDFYRCGVIIAGVFDMKTQMSRTDVEDLYFGENYMDLVMGEDETQLRETSPIHNIDKIKAPMLILHGTEDERTPFKGAEEFVDALKKAGNDFDYHWYKKEGHGNRNIDNQIDEWRRVEAFLDERL